MRTKSPFSFGDADAFGGDDDDAFADAPPSKRSTTSDPKRGDRAKSKADDGTDDGRPRPYRGARQSVPTAPTPPAPVWGKGQRRSLSHVEGAITVRGDTDVARELEAALSAPKDDDTLTLTHGFHAWPARMHPLIASNLLDSFNDDSVVLDPFMGSGTVLIESFVHGRRAIGVDLNPLSPLLAEIKLMRPSDDDMVRILATAEDVREASIDRVKRKVDTRAPLWPDLAKRYLPYVLKELAGLHDEIVSLKNKRDRDVLLMVFSAMVVKFSTRRADSSGAVVEKRVGKFFPSRFLVDKTRELTEGWRELRAATNPNAPVPKVFNDDARFLRDVVTHDVGLVITSPPYGGTYDYAHHHEERLAWLKLNPKRLADGEIGARRNLSMHPAAAKKRESLSSPRPQERWDDEVGSFLTSLFHVMSRDGRAIFLVGDAEIDGQRVDAAVQLERLAPHCGFRFVAAASAERPDWRGGSARREHLVMLAVDADRPTRASSSSTPQKAHRENDDPRARPSSRAPSRASSRPDDQRTNRPPRADEQRSPRPPRGDDKPTKRPAKTPHRKGASNPRPTTGAPKPVSTTGAPSPRKLTVTVSKAKAKAKSTTKPSDGSTEPQKS